MWVRGLKQRQNQQKEQQCQSHPMWVRGLKQYPYLRNLYKNKSHPMWVRGLKPNEHYEINPQICRILCGCVD